MSPSGTSAPRRVPPLLLGGAVVVVISLGIAACAGTRALVSKSLEAPRPTATRPPNPAESVSVAPGTGVLSGRVIDAVTGLGVADAGVTLAGPNRRGLSGPDGRFRFDGVAAGPVTISFGPVDGYVPRSVQAQQRTEGVDLGTTPLLPVTSPRTYLVPQYGGDVPGCRDSRLSFQPATLTEPVALSLTCVEDPADFPAAPPAGRLPLAVVDASPAPLEPSSPPSLTVELPAQPRYAAGVALDLARLNLDTLTWEPAGQVLVDPGGRTASGSLSRLGTYLVMAPPFGQFSAPEGAGATVNQFSISDRPDHPPVDVFGPDTPLVYASFDFSSMDNTPILVRTLDEKGEIAFQSERPYTGSGRDNVPMVAPDGRSWPVGAYITTLYVGDPPRPDAGEISWTVASAPTPVPARPTLIAMAADSGPLPAFPVLVPGGCVPASFPYPRVVFYGDTLSDLAMRTQTSVADLMAANCLSGDTLRAGQVIWLRMPPANKKQLPYQPPKYPPYSWKPTPSYPTQPLPPPVEPTWPVAPSMPPPLDPNYPGGPPISTPWKTAQPPGGWNPGQPGPLPTRPQVFPTEAPQVVWPTSAPPPPPPPPPPPVEPQPAPVTKWTPPSGPEPTLAPFPTPP